MILVEEEGGGGYLTTCHHIVLCLGISGEKGANMKQSDSEATDELFTQIKLKLLDLRQSDPQVVEELKNLITQLEDFVESLVMDSIRKADKKSGREKR
jgi:hypothetical protein